MFAGVLVGMNVGVGLAWVSGWGMVVGVLVGVIVGVERARECGWERGDCHGGIPPDRFFVIKPSIIFNIA